MTYYQNKKGIYLPNSFMKKIFLTLFIFLPVIKIYAQDGFPSYPKIIKTYFKLYVKDDDYGNLLNFAKKKDGWYYQRVNTVQSNQLLEEEKFWTPENGYNPNINTLGKQEADSGTINTEAAEYLTSISINPWYGYERCRYFGYTGWEHDMIKDYGSADTLTDTLLEGLARAYSSLANTYLWYQSGGEQLKADTLQRQLERLELPSAERLSKVDYYLAKSIATYQRLIQQNPSYSCLVGNVSLKKFNEAMNGYMQMTMSLRNDKAAEYLDKCSLEKEYITQAKNYLNSCDSNAIVFTYGDNDTYQLWYVQEKENYRQDVAVINTSLLGLSIYIDMLKKNKTVSFTATPDFYGKKESDIAYYQNEPTGSIKKELKKFLQDIYSFKKTTSAMGMDGEKKGWNVFNVKDLIIRVSPSGYNKSSSFKTADMVMKIVIKNYLLLNDILMLDIVSSNINSRPIYFTSSSTGLFNNNLIQQGILFKLFPQNKLNRQLQQQKIKKLEQFAEKTYSPVVTFVVDGAEHLCIDGNNSFFQLYSTIADYYKEKKDNKTSKLWIDKAMKIISPLSDKNFPAAYLFISVMQKNDKEKLKQFCEAYAGFCYQKFFTPSALKGFMSEEECLEKLELLSKMLKDEKIESSFINGLIGKFKAAKK
jgi:hypothetical protein